MIPARGSRAAVIRNAILSIRTPSSLFMLSRAIIAFAQLTIYVFTPFSYLTAQVGGRSHADHCADGLAFWNIICSGVPPRAIQVIIAVVLVLVISGVVPRITGLLHLYIAICTSSGLTHIDGGESAAVVALTWIAIICVFDHRANGWAKPEVASFEKDVSWWYGVPRAAGVALKIQCSIIYLHSATAKFGTTAWVDGSALYYVLRMDMFGVSGPLAPLVLSLTAKPGVTFSLTFGVIAAEFLIAVFIWFPGRVRYLAVAISVTLHISIIVLLGIASFGLIMIGLVLAAVVARDFSGLLGYVRNPKYRKVSSTNGSSLP